MRNILFVFLFANIFVCCHSNVKPYEVSLQPSDELLTLHSDTNYQRFSLSIPFKLEFKNNSLFKRRIGAFSHYRSVEYGKAYYKKLHRNGWTSSIMVYEWKNGEQIYWRRSGKEIKETYVKRSQVRTYIAYVKYLLDTTVFVNDEIHEYITQMKDSNVMDLPISSSSGFKVKHPELTSMLLKGDSIEVQIYDRKDEYESYITLPIEY